MTSCIPKQVHQSQDHRGLDGETSLGRTTGGDIHKDLGIKQIPTLRGGTFFFSCRNFGSSCSSDGEEKPSVH